jgi:hypothetical protein
MLFDEGEIGGDGVGIAVVIRAALEIDKIVRAPFV